MAVRLSGPKFYVDDDNGFPLSGGKVYFYEAGSFEFLKDTFTGEETGIANTNPVILNAAGYAAVFLEGSYNIQVYDANDVLVWTEENISSNNDQEWIGCGAATYVSPASFSVTGNKTAQYTAGRRVRMYDGSSYTYSTVLSSAFSNPLTTVQLVDSSVGVGITQACYSIVSDSSLPVSAQEWIDCRSFTRINSTTFSLEGDQRNFFDKYRSVRVSDSILGFLYSFITDASLVSGKTQVVVADAIITNNGTQVCRSIVGDKSLNKDIFSTVEEMKSYNMQAGRTVRTRSYSPFSSTVKAQGGASYQILTLAQWQALTGGTTPNGYNDHTLANGNVAALILQDTIYPEIFGAKGNGVANDTAAITAAGATGQVLCNKNYNTTFANVPAYAYGAGKMILTSPARTEWVDRSMKTDRKRVSPSGFSFVPNYGIRCTGPNAAQHNINLTQLFEVNFALYFGTQEYWVDPVNGLDTNSGSVFAPFKTVKKAYQASSPSVIRLKSGTYTDRFLLEYSDNNVSGLPRPIRIIGMGEVIFRAPGDQPSVLTWTLDATYSPVTYTATPSGSETVNAILWEKDGLSTLLPYYSVGADLALANLGWFQDSSTKAIYIKLGGFNVETFKSTLEIMYSRILTLGTRGTRTYLENVTFRGDSSFYCTVDGSSRRSHLYQKNVIYEYLEQMNFRTEGSTAFSQKCISRFSLNGDGFNYYDESGTPGGEISNVLEIDCKAYSNGIPITNLDAGDPSVPARTWDTNRNKQGSSGHNSSVICRINGEYYNNFGQNIADTGATSKTWMIGSDCKDLYAELWNVGVYGRYMGLWTEGDAFLDSVRSAGTSLAFGFYNQSGRSKHVNCSYSGFNADIALIAGTIEPLDVELPDA